MSTAQKNLTTWALMGLVVLCWMSASIAADTLLIVGKPPTKASFSGFASNQALRFQVGAESQHVELNELVRWSNPRSNRKRSELLLVDGSRLVLADSWTGKPSWEYRANVFEVALHSLGKIKVSADCVRALLLQAPTELPRRTKFTDHLLSDKQTSDRLHLINGDILSGELVGIENDAEGSPQIVWSVDVASEPFAISAQRVAALVFGQDEPNAPPSKASLMLGLSDGSLLTARSWESGGKQFRVELDCGLKLSEPSSSEIVYLRSLKMRGVYLSDITPTEYRHVPYLDIHWPYQNDRNVLGSPLLVSGRRFAKGLGMTSAARLTFSLDTDAVANRFHRFAAEVGIDEAAEKQGSAVFRVYLHRSGKWQEAYASPILRGGDAPVPIQLELQGATQLALSVDYGDRGDERDYANWIDARLE